MMKISLEIDDFLLELFPKYRKSDNNLDVLKEELIHFYTYGPFKPNVTLKDGWAVITIDVPSIISQEADYKKIIALCEKGKYTEAKPILRNLIQKNPTNSEFHRILGQILSDEGDQEEAINSLIDSLKWDPKNGYALLMMGNIFAKYRNDIETAMKYYNQALKINSKDNIAVNNIGANLMQFGKIKEGVEYFEKAYELNPNYPNTSYGLAIAYDTLGNPFKAFDYAIKCLRISSVNGGGVLHKSISNCFSYCRGDL